jgi:hypothetical protein
MRLIEILEERKLFSTTYYVDPTAGGTNTGLTPANAWTSLAPINSTSFNPGDSILFRSSAGIGSSAALGGFLTFGSDDGTGTLTTPPAPATLPPPVILNTYSGYSVDSNGNYTLSGAGTGTFTINAPSNHNGMLFTDTAGFEINNLNVVGSGQAAASYNGIQFDDNLSGNVQLPHVWMNNVNVSHFGNYGITVGGSNGKSGFTDVRIANSTSSFNIVGGIETHGVFSGTATTYANSNVTVDHCTVNNNPGYAGSPNHTGDGIVISDVDNSNYPSAAIQHDIAFNNGAQNTHVGGPVGIWSWDCNAVTIQYSESYNNQTNSTADGGGFDLDGGDTNCILQYNYSHGNAGAGYGLFQFSGARPYNNNTVRFNISENDGRKNGYGAITVWGYNSTSLKNSEVYNNTIYVSSGGGSPMAVYIESGTQNLHFRNNIFQVASGLQLAYIKGTQSGLLFQGNDYWSSGGAFSIKQFTKTYSSLSAWRKGTSQETLSGSAVGYNIAPGFAGTPGTGSAAMYMLAASSPLNGASLNLTSLFKINPGTQDYFGDSTSNGWNIGAD